MAKYDLPVGWKRVNVGSVLKRVREPVAIEPNCHYREIGIRSHGKGIFYKDEVSGKSLGNKSVFWIEPDCFVVNIVFAWEQAVAKTTANEEGMIASHRFPMYKPVENKLDLDYILYFFKTPFGKHLLNLASPGGAGRNKTLGQEEFQRLTIPLPPYSEQKKIAEILSTWDEAIARTEQLIAALQKRKKGLMQRLLTGEVRFREFGESKTNTNHDFPPDWKIMEFGTFVSKVNSKFNTSSKTVYPCIELEHLSQETGKILGYITSDRQKSIKNVFKAGQVLFGKLRPYLRKYAYAEFDGVCSSEIWVLNGKKSVCDNLYLFYLVQTDRFISIANVTSGTKMPRADWEYVSDTVFGLPSIPEQVRIATVLKDCDNEITLHSQKLEALKQQKKGLMQCLLTGQVRVTSKLFE